MVILFVIVIVIVFVVVIVIEALNPASIVWAILRGTRSPHAPRLHSGNQNGTHGMVFTIL